ncbi:glycerophosphoryl diester phosphodiesterase [Nocardioides marinisabuli]|uniref:glycerophosphodiester phosphodiesterase n=1 Tax=Nocardioides marinisabuli TaxID=419476 RepID=A0A7Y9JR30_9ACTN|nr:glycerophosphodiester phosphodiesterase [Nocardioides marinisabuli]NYD58075.1 glycerophosphoryl diester phosphodiesterase [Nocardioides marinisabuli]
MTSRTSRFPLPSTAPTTRLATGLLGGLSAVLAGSLLLAPGAAAAPDQRTRAVEQLATPVVVAHRGASGYRPEHTLAAYRLAIRLGADYIEPDLVSTRDGVLVARHENEISGTTDVADHPEFADRRTTRTIDGRETTGWFTEDFTLAELRTLRAVERLPGVRPDNTRYDGRFTVPTFTEVLRLVRRESKRTGRTIGVAPETKHPTYFDSAGLSLEEPLLAALERFDLDQKRSKVLIQSFETTNLREIAALTKAPVEQLMSGSGAPYDLVAAGDDTTYADLATPAGLAEVATYADWIGPEKSMVVPRTADGAAGEPTALVDDAHAAGLRVVVYTVRDENQFMPTTYRRGVDPDAKGDVFAEITDLLDAGIDGLFADHPDSGVFARDEWVRDRG